MFLLPCGAGEKAVEETPFWAGAGETAAAASEDGEWFRLQVGGESSSRQWGWLPGPPAHLSHPPPLCFSGAARTGTAGTQAATGAAPGPEAGAEGSGPAGPAAILPEEM